MSTPFYENDLEDENSMMKTKRLISLVSSKIDNINSISHLSTDRIKEMQENVASIKSELQGIVVKVEQNVRIFKGKITSKIALVLNLLKKKQLHIQNTLDNCYKIIDNLVDTFIKVGHELEKDIIVISVKVSDFDKEIKKLVAECRLNNNDDTMWFINSDGRLTKRKNVVLSSSLPRFKCGDKNMRRSFIIYLTNVFTAFQVPKGLWVKLAANQLVGMAQDWWNIHDKDMNWSQFAESFIEWSFNDNRSRTNIPFTGKQNENEMKRMSNTEMMGNAYIPQQQPLCSKYNGEMSNIYNHKSARNNKMNDIKQAASKHIVDRKTESILSPRSNFSLPTVQLEDTEEESSHSSASSEKSLKKRKFSIYTTSNKSTNKRRKIIETENENTTQPISSVETSRYKLRKRK